MKKTYQGKLIWERETTFAGDYSTALFLTTDEGKFRAQNILERFSDQKVKITIEVIDEEGDTK